MSEALSLLVAFIPLLAAELRKQMPGLAEVRRAVAVCIQEWQKETSRRHGTPFAQCGERAGVLRGWSWQGSCVKALCSLE